MCSAQCNSPPRPSRSLPSVCAMWASASAPHPAWFRMLTCPRVSREGYGIPTHLIGPFANAFVEDCGCNLLRVGLNKDWFVVEEVLCEAAPEEHEALEAFRRLLWTSWSMCMAKLHWQVVGRAGGEDSGPSYRRGCHDCGDAQRSVGS